MLFSAITPPAWSRVTFVPRSVAAQWAPRPESALISIYDRKEQPLQPQGGWDAVLYLRFHDTDGSQGGLEVFSPEQARCILDFVQQNAQKQELVVHCQMGQSRSAAVALFLAELAQVPCFQEGNPVTAAKWPFYNRKVYGTLYDVAYGPRGSAFEADVNTLTND